MAIRRGPIPLSGRKPGQPPTPKVSPTILFHHAVLHMPLVPRCQAEVDGRQCKNVATRRDTWCGQHWKGVAR